MLGADSRVYRKKRAWQTMTCKCRADSSTMTNKASKGLSVPWLSNSTNVAPLEGKWKLDDFSSLENEKLFRLFSDDLNLVQHDPSVNNFRAIYPQYIDLDDSIVVSYKNILKVSWRQGDGHRKEKGIHSEYMLFGKNSQPHFLILLNSKLGTQSEMTYTRSYITHLNQSLITLQTRTQCVLLSFILSRGLMSLH